MSRLEYNMRKHIKRFYEETKGMSKDQLIYNGLLLSQQLQDKPQQAKIHN